VIHYHGTPITPRTHLYNLAGRHFCVSFAEPRDADVCMQIGQSVLWDNGAFSLYTSGREINERALYEWVGQRLGNPHRAVVLDKIDGDVDEQRAYLERWPYSRDVSWPVWHLDKPLDYLLELADHWCGLCLGSSGDYWKIGTQNWERRMDEAFNHLSRHRTDLPWVHGLRMLGQAGNRWPLSSADSANIARNHAGSSKSAPKCPSAMAQEIDARQCPIRWEPRLIQEEFAA